MSVDEQTVYTSEADPITGESIQKPMSVTGQLVDELGRNLSFRNVKVTYEMLGSQLEYELAFLVPLTSTDSSRYYVHSMAFKQAKQKYR